MTGAALGVVVPAWNEERVIGHCLAALVNQELPGPLKIAVVANGCSDHTADVARAFRTSARQRGIELAVVECDARGKPAALNIGDQLFPPSAHRLYLDADACLSPSALAALVAAFEAGTEFAAPELILDYSHAPAACRAYWRCWAALPNVRADVVGGGAYGVSARGRARWDRFPEVIADDLYVRSHFTKDEAVIVNGVSFTTPAPASVAGTLRMLTRWRRGNVEHELLGDHKWRTVAAPGTVTLANTSVRHTATAILAHASVRDLAVFTFITAVVRTLAVLSTRVDAWERGR